MTRVTLTRMTTPRYRRRVMLVCASLALVVACREGTSVGQSRGTAAAKAESEQTVSAGELAQKGGGCDLNKRVVDPPPETAEWVIWRAYQLALGPDDAAAFAAFVALFPPERNQRELKEMYWPRLRANVHKYVVEPGKPDYVICRSVATDNGRKYFIVSAEPKQMPPPVTIGDIEGRPKIVFLTPF